MEKEEDIMLEEQKQMDETEERNRTNDIEEIKSEDNKSQSETEQTPITRPLSHRIFAWIVIVLLVAMYVITLIAAISGSGTASALFMMSMGSTVVLPGALWIHIRLWKHATGQD